MKHKISQFALCWVVVGPVVTVHGPYDHETARHYKRSYNSQLPTNTNVLQAKVRLADGTEIDDEGFPV
jgi:hypothetical protein